VSYVSSKSCTVIELHDTDSVNSGRVAAGPIGKP